MVLVWLVQDCKRNAQYARDRSHARRLLADVRYTNMVFGRLEFDGDDDRDRVPAVDATDSIVEALTSALCIAAVETANSIGSTCARFVHLLMEGYSVAEAAESTGISRATGYRWSARLAEALTPWREVAA